jgi:hypothetical protein
MQHAKTIACRRTESGVSRASSHAGDLPGDVRFAGRHALGSERQDSRQRADAATE